MQLSIGQKQLQVQTCNQQIQQALFLLRMNAAELTDYLSELATENPVLELEEPQAAETQILMTTGEAAPGVFPGSRQAAEPFAGSRRSLRADLIAQLDVRRLGAAELRAAKAIIDSLDSRSYFTDSLEEISRACSVTMQQASRALRAVQSLDPPGVGARTLTECLCLQLRRRGIREKAPYCMVQEYLEELAHSRYALIASKLHISRTRATEYGALIRSLSPGVSNEAEGEVIHYVYPEIAVSLQDGTLEVRVDERKLPRLSINAEYRGMQDLDREAKAYLKDQYAMASRTLQSLELWKTMLQRVAEKVVTAQKAFFVGGGSLEPLRMADIAEQLDVSIPTVSRALAGKYLSCDQGVYPLKHFLSGKLPAEGKGSVSSDYVRGRIREMLGHEPELSDQALTERLQRKGIRIARRTVAKYRAQMGIASVYGRKQAR